MRGILLSALVCCFITASDAQTAIRAPLPVAFQLYKDCVANYFQVGDVELPGNGPDANQLLTELDSRCLDWAVVWLPVLAPRDMTKDEMKRLDAQRTAYLRELYVQLMDIVEKHQ